MQITNYNKKYKTVAIQILISASGPIVNDIVETLTLLND